MFSNTFQLAQETIWLYN